MAKRRVTQCLLIVAALASNGCSPADNEPGPGGVSVGEARELEEAADIIESRRLPPPGVAPEGAQDGAVPTGSGDSPAPQHAETTP